MKDLLLVELTRLRWRRAVLVLVAVAVILPAVIFAATAWNTRPLSADEQREIDQIIAQESQQPYVLKELARCLKHPERYGAEGSDDPQAACEAVVLPQAEWYGSRESLDLTRELDDSGIGVSVVVTMLMILLGTTFVGHDWNSGSMSNQLLFEPRRVRVWGAKAVVVLLAGTLVAAAVLTAYWTGLWVLTEQRDLPQAAGALGDGYHQARRAAVLAGLAGLGGYGLTMLFRSTVTTLGILFAVSIAGPLLITLSGIPGNQQLMPQNNYAAVLLDGFTFTDYNRDECLMMDGDPAGSESDCVVRVSQQDGWVYFGTLLLLATVPSVASFRRRDVP